MASPQSQNAAEPGRRPRLAVFTNEFPGKVTTFISRDVRALIEYGFDVEVFAFRPYEEEMWRYVPGLLDERVFPRDRAHHVTLGGALGGLLPRSPRELAVQAGDGLRVLAASAPHGVEPFVKSAYVLPKAWTWARQFGRRYDHVLAYWGNYAATCAYAFHRLAGRDIPFSMFLHAGMDLYWKRPFLRRKLEYADNIFVVCEFNRGFIHEHYPDLTDRIADRIHLHHLGLALDDVAYDARERPARKLIGVGRLAGEKGYAYLMRAIGALHRDGFDVTLDLVGEGPLEGELRELAAELGVEEQVHFRGWLTIDEVQEAIRGATVLVHPSDGLGDAVPTVIKESLALGTPVIGSDIVGIPELLDGGNCGVLVPQRDPAALARAIRELLDDPPRRRELAERGRAFAEATFDVWHNGKALATRLHETRRRA